MKAGRLTERIRLMRPEVTLNAFGERRTSYERYADIWADKVWLGGDTKTEVQENFAGARQEFLIHYAHPVREDWRVIYDGIEYRVTAIDKNQRRNLKRVRCERINL